MLKRNGQRTDWVLSTFTHGERDAYLVTLQAIQPDLDGLSRIRRQCARLSRITGEREAGASGRIVIDDTEWQVHSQLLRLPQSGIFLCHDTRSGTFAIIQRFPAESPYALANGLAEILLHGSNARQLVREYTSQAQHTLRFMASNLVAKAQRVAFEQFPKHNPGRVVRTISERCRRVIGESVTVTESARQTNRQGQSVRT